MQIRLCVTGSIGHVSYVEDIHHCSVRDASQKLLSPKNEVSYVYKMLAINSAIFIYKLIQ